MEERRYRWLIVAGVVSGCDLGTDQGDTPPRVEYVVDALEVFEKSYVGVDHPIAYVRASAFAVNVSDDSVRVFTDCAPRGLEAIPSSDHGPAANPVWRSRSRLTWPGGVSTGCLSNGDGALLGPADTFQSRYLEYEISLAEVLADSLPAGMYRFRVGLAGTATVGSSVEILDSLLDLGEVYLPESRYPLSDTYRRDGFRYRVRRSPGSAPGVAAIVTLDVTYVGSGTPLSRSLSQYCPIRLRAFRSVEDLETIPVPTPAWTWPPEPLCGPGELPVRLGPGEALTFTTEVWVPSDVLREGESIEDFSLMAVVDVRGRPIRLAVP